MSRVITLNDGMQIEAHISGPTEISDYDEVDSSLEKLQSLLKKVYKPIANSIDEISDNLNIESTKVSLGVKVGAEGNFFVAKSKGEANIQIEMTLGKKNA